MFHKIFWFFLLLSPLANAEYSKLVVFGDSLSDMGNACPKGDFQKSLLCVLYPTQRFTNGKVWVEYLAEEWGVDLEPSSLGGDNFAYAGATSGWGSEKTPGLTTQLNSYFEKVEHKADPNALYVIWIGGNDFKDTFLNLSFLSDFEQLLFKKLLEDISNSVIRLSRKGARHFLIPNLPSVHEVPLVTNVLTGLGVIFSGLSWMRSWDDKEESSSLKAFFDIGFEAILASYNWRLARRLKILEEERNLEIHHPDVFHLFKELEQNYKNYGFEKAEDLFYFDRFHPSAKCHEILAKEIAKNL